MPLELLDGEECFVDANILHHALVPTFDTSTPCLSFLDRAVAGLIYLSVSIQVLSDHSGINAAAWDRTSCDQRRRFRPRAGNHRLETAAVVDRRIADVSSRETALACCSIAK
jgi:hypothetical protein